MSLLIFYIDILTTRVSDPDPVGSGVFAWIRIRISLDPDPVFKFSGSGSGSGFSQDSGKLQKSDLSEENLKFMTKDRQKMKKATISY